MKLFRTLKTNNLHTGLLLLAITIVGCFSLPSCKYALVNLKSVYVLSTLFACVVAFEVNPLWDT